MFIEEKCISGWIGNDLFDCCGKIQYNMTSHLCCGADVNDPVSQLVDATFAEHSFCCRLGVYDDRVEGCCNGLPYNLAGQ